VFSVKQEKDFQILLHITAERILTIPLSVLSFSYLHISVCCKIVLLIFRWLTVIVLSFKSILGKLILISPRELGGWVGGKDYTTDQKDRPTSRNLCPK
jgi:hypothetical protein